MQRIASVMQEYTQSGGERSFEESLLIRASDSDRPYLFQCNSSRAYFAWKATAMDKNSINSKTFLDKRYSEDLELDDTVHTVILALKEDFEDLTTENNIEMSVSEMSRFSKINASAIREYLAKI